MTIALDVIPPWYICIALGLQHFLVSFGGNIAYALIVTPLLCVNDDVIKSEIICTIFFVTGLFTLIQATFGARLPLVYGIGMNFMAPSVVILSLPQWKCPGSEYHNISNDSSQSHQWEPRMNEIQGAVIVSALCEVLIGMTGFIGVLMKYITPLVIAPVITLIGLPLTHVASHYCHKHWGIAACTIALLVLFSQYLRNIHLPIFYWCRKTGKWVKLRFPIFKLLPVVLAVFISWSICVAFTFSNVLSDKPEDSGYNIRTDNRMSVISDAKWFRFPYPGQWGVPTVNLASVLGMLAAIISGIIQAVGTFYASARLSGLESVPKHAMNRGIMVQGLGSVLAGLWGTGGGVAIYNQNVGAIGITKEMGSRRVIQACAVLTLLVGMFGKFGAVFITIPDPIIGGILMVMFGTITAVGISNVQYIDLNSPRNIFILGFSIFLGMALPGWTSENFHLIKTGSDVGDQILIVLMSTHMFVGGITAFIFDNTIPGTREERGLDIWIGKVSDSLPQLQSLPEVETFDIPYIRPITERQSCLRFIPVCPTFEGFLCRKDQISMESTTCRTNSSAPCSELTRF